MKYTVNPKIVRGLDYYTRTVFEFISGDIGAQSTVCGGGRYDGLVGQMGGPNTAALGFAMGIERLMLVLYAQKAEFPEPKTCDVYIAPMGDEAALAATSLCTLLRKEGFVALTDISGRGLKAQMKYADKKKARFTLIIGDSELENNKAQLKDMDNSNQCEISLDDIASLKNILSAE
jgi:histidyl-tRNA synthetase